jgi:L-ascorbate metabolism protein UlaG (beta-lactamase superfamily)
MPLAWLGHSTVVLDLAGVRLVTDPLLRRHAGLLRRDGPAPDPALWRGADAVLLSHLHHDHADLPSLRMLPGVPVLTLPAPAEWLTRHGVEAVGLAVGERHRVGDVEVVAVPAEHHSRPMPYRPSDACGHVVDGAAVSIWVAGDTDLFDGLEDVPRASRHHRVDVAAVPVGGWGPRLSRGHLDPATAGWPAAAAAGLAGATRAGVRGRRGRGRAGVPGGGAAAGGAGGPAGLTRVPSCRSGTRGVSPRPSNRCTGTVVHSSRDDARSPQVRCRASRLSVAAPRVAGDEEQEPPAPRAGNPR